MRGSRGRSPLRGVWGAEPLSGVVRGGAPYAGGGGGGEPPLPKFDFKTPIIIFEKTPTT